MSTVINHHLTTNHYLTTNHHHLVHKILALISIHPIILYIFIHDHPGLILISKKQTGFENYNSWKRNNGDREQRKRLIQFLMGLDEYYINLRGQILLLPPLPTVAKAYSIIRQEEKQREGILPKPLGSTALSAQTYRNNSTPRNTNSPYANRTQTSMRSTFRPTVYYINLSKEGHNNDECYKLKGYQIGHPLHGKYKPPVARSVNVNDTRNAKINLVQGNDNIYITLIKQHLHKEFSINDLGSLNYYLGIEILRNQTRLIMTKRKYTLELLQSAGLLNVKPSSIPFDPLTKLNHDDGDPLDDPSQYRTLVGKLLYFTITRPNNSYTAQTLSQFIQAPRTPHLKALVKVLRYLKSCPGQVIFLLFFELIFVGVLFTASGGSDRDAEDELSKLLQISTVAEYKDEFEMLINRVTWISESLLTSFYIYGLKVALQTELLRTRPTTFREAFFLACITETHFEDKRSASAITKPNDLNTRVHIQNLEETTRHKPNKVEAIKSSGSSLLVEPKYYAANQVGLIFNQSNEAIYYERILELIADSCASVCVSISWTLGMICKRRIYNSKHEIPESRFLDNTLRTR
nr:uncharacterized mitochondrial protein AtMg00810-like [Tanacetum cinerariifolium]